MRKSLFIFSCFITTNTYASDMGNGPAGLTALTLGIPLALIFSYFFSAKRNEDGTFGKLDVAKFIGSLILSAILVLVVTVYVTFA